ncbi:transglutaminase-like cysteine peptidase [Microbulbifer marinus]|nr:transglutaminase-like cysteine peptidase [Microbulbifer marinus]
MSRSAVAALVARAALLCTFACGLLVAGRALPSSSPLLSPALLEQMSARYGKGAVWRLLEWNKLLGNQQSASERLRLRHVNQFLNRVPFVEDAEHWGLADYWATPAEFLASNGGDCEDFAIAKLFTLQAAEVPADRLRLMYVNARLLNQPHMVLLYIEEGQAPLVLDNLTNAIQPAGERADLEPVYSFNSSGLWLNRPDSPERKVRDHSGSLMWEDLVERMRREIGE